MRPIVRLHEGTRRVEAHFPVIVLVSRPLPMLQLQKCCNLEEPRSSREERQGGISRLCNILRLRSGISRCMDHDRSSRTFEDRCSCRKATSNTTVSQEQVPMQFAGPVPRGRGGDDGRVTVGSYGRSHSIFIRVKHEHVR